MDRAARVLAARAALATGRGYLRRRRPGSGPRLVRSPIRMSCSRPWGRSPSPSPAACRRLPRTPIRGAGLPLSLTARLPPRGLGGGYRAGRPDGRRGGACRPAQPSGDCGLGRAAQPASLDRMV